MPASTQQAADGRVRTPVSSLQEKAEHLHFNEAPARCRSPCCAPRPYVSMDLRPSPKRDPPPPLPSRAETRPALNRNAASHVSAASGKSCYSMGTDGSLLQSEDGFAEFGDMVDSATFEQILEMDDDEEEREFSKSIVYDFFTQADSTFTKMDAQLERKDLNQLSQLGHFLKGSSATLGLTKVKDSCEKIQNFGAHKDETGAREEPDDEVCLDNCKKTIKEAKEQFQHVEAALKRFYRDEGS
ncbi:Phosphorelay intermediate protein [Saxophila tyrrhenica]|uniref:Phosphorelay intermediate protein n=1 Tax=Saxophila tyrrhenica TaxID=1690608 RepID=A0AAV9PNH6_9PEZI|nr:Phosphorelay intermediate protein [Saxophila tyrrhenica]